MRRKQIHFLENRENVFAIMKRAVSPPLLSYWLKIWMFPNMEMTLQPVKDPMMSQHRIRKTFVQMLAVVQKCEIEIEMVWHGK